MTYTKAYEITNVPGTVTTTTAVLDYHFNTFLPTRGWDVHAATGAQYGTAAADARFWWIHKDFPTITGGNIQEHTLYHWIPSALDLFIYDTSNSIPNYGTGAVQANWDARKQCYTDGNFLSYFGGAQWWVSDTTNSWFVVSRSKIVAWEFPSGGYVDRRLSVVSSVNQGAIKCVWFGDGINVGATWDVASGYVNFTSGLYTSTPLTRASDLIVINFSAAVGLYWIGSAPDMLMKWHSNGQDLFAANCAITQIGSNFYYDSGGNNTYGVLFNVGTTEPTIAI